MAWQQGRQIVQYFPANSSAKTIRKKRFLSFRWGNWTCLLVETARSVVMSRVQDVAGLVEVVSADSTNHRIDLSQSYRER